MKNFFKWYRWNLGWVLTGALVVILAVMLIVGLKPSTCDFRGYVDEVSIDSENNCVWISVTMLDADVPTLIKVGEGVSVKYYDGQKTSADKIKEGEMIDLDVKKQKAGDYYEAEWIKVYPKD